MPRLYKLIENWFFNVLPEHGGAPPTMELKPAHTYDFDVASARDAANAALADMPRTLRGAHYLRLMRHILRL